jgi:hypothetical protein
MSFVRRTDAGDHDLFLTVVLFMFYVLRVVIAKGARMLDLAITHPAITHPAIKDFGVRSTRTRCHDEFQRRADECRTLAASARNAGDRAFWLGLVHRWQALETQSPHLFVARRQQRVRRGRSI